MPTVSVSQYVDVDVDVELDDIDTDEMALHLRDKGYQVDGLPMEDIDVRSFEFRIWQALRERRTDELVEICREMVLQRINRFA